MFSESDRSIEQHFPAKRTEDAAKIFGKAEELFTHLGSDTVIRELSHMPSKNSRPGLGRLNSPGFASTSAIVAIHRHAPHTVEVSLIAPEGDTIGRPLSRRANNYGRPNEDDASDQYKRITVFLTPDWVTTQMYGERPDGTWEVFDGLVVQADNLITTDAAMFIDVCVGALIDGKRHTEPVGVDTRAAAA